MKLSLKIFLAAVFFGVVGWTLYYLYKKTYPPAPPYKMETPVKATITRKSVAVGSIVPRKEVDIKPRISGIVDEILVQPGDKVKEGDVLTKIKIIPNMASLRDAELRLSQAHIALEDAERNFARNKQLIQNNVISDNDFQIVEIKLKKAKEDNEAAEDNLKIIKEGIYGDSQESSNTIVRSTIDGMVLTVPITVGKSVTETNNFNEGTTLATVADMTKLVFKGKIDESDVGKLRENMDVTLSIGAMDAEKLSAMLEYISPKGIEDKGAMLFEIQAAVKLKENFFIRAGYSATAEIIIEKKENVLSISESFIQFKDGKPFVEVEKAPGIFESREIKTGVSDGIRIEVISGLTEKDKIKAPTQSSVNIH